MKKVIGFTTHSISSQGQATRQPSLSQSKKMKMYKLSGTHMKEYPRPITHLTLLVIIMRHYPLKAFWNQVDGLNQSMSTLNLETI